MIKFVLTLLFVPAMAFAQGSGSVGDGGGGVACKNSGAGEASHYKYTIRFLDFYELGGYHNQNQRDQIVGTDWLSPETTKSVRGYLLRAMSKTMKVLSLNVQMRSAFDVAYYLAEEVRIVPTIPRADNFVPKSMKLPSHCRFIQLGYRYGDQILVARNESEYLNHMDLAGLLLHEALHSVFEGAEAKPALRQFVGFAFANPEFQKRNAKQATQLLSTHRPVQFKK